MARDSTETIEYSIVFHMYLCNIWEWLNDWLFLCITKYRSKNFRNESPLTKQKSFDKAESGILTYFFSNLPINFFLSRRKNYNNNPPFPNQAISIMVQGSPTARRCTKLSSQSHISIYLAGLNTNVRQRLLTWTKMTTLARFHAEIFKMLRFWPEKVSISCNLSSKFQNLTVKFWNCRLFPLPTWRGEKAAISKLCLVVLILNVL